MILLFLPPTGKCGTKRCLRMPSGGRRDGRRSRPGPTGGSSVPDDGDCIRRCSGGQWRGSGASRPKVPFNPTSAYLSASAAPAGRTTTRPLLTSRHAPTSHRDILELLVQTRVDVEIEGERFEAGSQRVMFYAAANHDPLAFPDPDRFDIARSATGHLAFSAGPHYCLGAPLARMEAEIGLSTLFRRIPGLVTGQPIWRGSAPLRQIESLPVEADPRRTELPSPSQDSPDPAGSIKSWEPSCTIRRVCRLYARPTGETRFRI
jgi:hypothetical protein